MAFPNATVYPVTYPLTSQIPVRGVLWVDWNQQTHHNIFENSRFVGLCPLLQERAGIGLDIVRYVTDDIYEAEGLVYSMLPLSVVSLTSIREQLRESDLVYGRTAPVW